MSCFRARIQRVQRQSRRSVWGCSLMRARTERDSSCRRDCESRAFSATQTRVKVTWRTQALSPTEQQNQAVRRGPAWKEEEKETKRPSAFQKHRMCAAGAECQPATVGMGHMAEQERCQGTVHPARSLRDNAAGPSTACAARISPGANRRAQGPQCSFIRPSVRQIPTCSRSQQVPQRQHQAER